MLFPLGSSFSRFAVALLVLSLAPFTQAFFPSDWRSKYFGASGTSHETQTRRAFESLAQTYFPTIKSLTSSMIQALDVINKAQMAVDDDQEHSAKHFDGENFDGGQAILVQAKQNVGDALRKGDASGARNILGAALHTVEDFYAHSNWVELGNSDIQYLLGKKDGKLIFAAFNERTCHDCGFGGLARLGKGCRDCSKNTNDFNKLTSGYYFGEDAPPNKQTIPNWKCHHGGATDSRLGAAGGIAQAFAMKDVTPGINKDANECFFSPHYFLHPKAADLATKAATQYIKDLVDDENLNDQQRKLLFGAGTTLAFALDRTSDTARQHALEIAQSRLNTSNEPAQYVITPFGTEPLKIPDYEALVAYVNATYDSEREEDTEGDEYGGCNRTCLIDTMDMMDGPGEFFLLSDKPLNATAEDAPDAIDTALGNNIAINVLDYYEDVLDYAEDVVETEINPDSDENEASQDEDALEDDSGYGTDDSKPTRKRARLQKRINSISGQIFSALTSATGGSYQILSQSRLAAGSSPLSRLQLDEPDLSSDTRETILKVSGNLNTTQSFKIPIDSQMTSFTVSLSGGNTTFNLTRPDGSALDTTSRSVALTRISSSQYLTVNAPEAGSWTLTLAPSSNNVTASQFNATVSGMSPLKFSRFAFVEMRGRSGHQGYYPMTGRLISNGSAEAIASLSGDFSNAVFSLRDSMNRPMSHELQMTQGSGKPGFPPQESFLGEMDILPVESRVYVEGDDVEGMPFQRVWGEVVKPASEE